MYGVQAVPGVKDSPPSLRTPGQCEWMSAGSRPRSFQSISSRLGRVRFELGFSYMKPHQLYLQKTVLTLRVPKKGSG